MKCAKIKYENPKGCEEEEKGRKKKDRKRVRRYGGKKQGQQHSQNLIGGCGFAGWQAHASLITHHKLTLEAKSRKVPFLRSSGSEEGHIAWGPI